MNKHLPSFSFLYIIATFVLITVIPFGVESKDNSSLKVLSPFDGVVYTFGSPITIAWDTQNTDIDYFYVLLENTAIKNLGIVITSNLSVNTNSTSFVPTENLLYTFLAKSNGLNEEQLEDNYYVRVIGVKKGFFNNSPVINGISKIFSISSSRKAEVVTNQKSLSNSSDNDLQKDTQIDKRGAIIVGRPVIKDGDLISYPISLSFTIKAQEAPIYLSKITKDNNPIVFFDRDGFVVPSIIGSKTIPENISSDTVNYYFIPAGSSRQFIYEGTVINPNDTKLPNKIVQIKAIKYGTSSTTLQSSYITSGIDNLRAFLVFPIITKTKMVAPTKINSGAVYVGKTSADLGLSIVRNKAIVGYEYNMSATVTNISDYPIYIRNKKDGRDITSSINISSASVKYSIDSVPTILSGDRFGALIIPPRTSRTLYFSGVLSNYSERVERVSYNITGLIYGTSSSSFNQTITSGLDNLKITAKVGGFKKIERIYSPTIIYPQSPYNANNTNSVPNSSTNPTPTPGFTPTQTPTQTPTPPPTYGIDFNDSCILINFDGQCDDPFPQDIYEEPYEEETPSPPPQADPPPPVIDPPPPVDPPPAPPSAESASPDPDPSNFSSPVQDPNPSDVATSSSSSSPSVMNYQQGTASVLDALLGRLSELFLPIRKK